MASIQDEKIAATKPEPKPVPVPKPPKVEVTLSIQLKTKINQKRNELLKNLYKELAKKNPDWEEILNAQEAHERLVFIKSLIATHPPKIILGKK